MELLVRLWLIVVLVKIELLNTENKCESQMGSKTLKNTWKT